MRMAERISRQYDNAKCSSLWEAYRRPSVAKEKAWDYCMDLCKQHDGRGLRVLGYNSSFFTAGFLFNDKETGQLMVMRITAYSDKAYEYVPDEPFNVTDQYGRKMEVTRCQQE